MLGTAAAFSRDNFLSPDNIVLEVPASRANVLVLLRSLIPDGAPSFSYSGMTTPDSVLGL